MVEPDRTGWNRPVWFATMLSTGWVKLEETMDVFSERSPRKTTPLGRLSDAVTKYVPAGRYTTPGALLRAAMAAVMAG